MSLEQFLQLFGDITIGKAVTYLLAIIFIVKAYTSFRDYLKDKTEEEIKQRNEINNVIEMSKKYPEWREQSVKIQNEIKKQMEGMNKKIDNLALNSSDGMAYTWRYRILRFDDEVRHDKKHTKEHFDQILEDITSYEKYCKEHPDFPNNKAVFAISNIKDVYASCYENNSFL